MSKQYLVAYASKYTFQAELDKQYWSMVSEKYVEEVIHNVKVWLKKRELYLKSKALLVLPLNYTPELDWTQLCNDKDVNYYQQQIGVLRWAVKLGRIVICAEVSMMASYYAAPRVGHLDTIMHIFAYLNSHEQSCLVFDSSYVGHVDTVDPDWTEFFENAHEQFPPDMPTPPIGTASSNNMFF